MPLYFVSRNTGAKYKVANWNKETGEVTLVGPNVGGTWTEKFDKEKYLRMGYELMKLDDDEAEGSV